MTRSEEQAYEQGVHDTRQAIHDAMAREGENFVELALRHEHAGDPAPLFNARFIGQYLRRLGADILGGRA